MRQNIKMLAKAEIKISCNGKVLKRMLRFVDQSKKSRARSLEGLAKQIYLYAYGSRVNPIFLNIQSFKSITHDR